MGSFDSADKRHSIMTVACFRKFDNKNYSLGRMLLLIICLILVSLASKQAPHTAHRAILLIRQYPIFTAAQIMGSIINEQ